MIHQFTHELSEPRYWIMESDGRKVLIGNEIDAGQLLAYQKYRLGFRDVTHNTNERTMIATVLPSSVFCGNTINLFTSPQDGKTLLALTGILNSFVIDFIIRKKVSAHCHMFYAYQLPIPRITAETSVFPSICTDRVFA